MSAYQTQTPSPDSGAAELRVYSDGSRAWWLDGKIHRADGPAVEWSDGYREWWLAGHKYGPEADSPLHPRRRAGGAK